ncbi:expressed unknown protein [Seminavis robusta]|uniref:Band 7 domain-containing protein n=1 Tax=Seminavis robusta TaxID=568900 RepID=A0A9N8DZ44_9STRA|nr:expressed unknown protein [Seminavis robusta]|eukprot:Sro356_g125360.1 n/a (647) ;mRNA; r:37546-39486
MMEQHPATATATAPTEAEVIPELPPMIQAPNFAVPEWDADNEPLGMTRLRSGESFLDGVRRVAACIGGDSPVSKGCNSLLPGMRVAEDQVGVVLSNGSVVLRPPGAYRTTLLNPWKTHGAVVPISRTAGVEFDPLQETANRNPLIRHMELGQSYRMIVLQAQQIGVFEDQTATHMVSQGTYVYDNDTIMRGVIDLNRMTPVIVERETEDTVASVTSGNSTQMVNQHGRPKASNQAHGTMIETKLRFIPAGYVSTVAGVTIAKPEKGFVVLHKDARNRISVTEGICMASGNQDFFRNSTIQNKDTKATIDDLEIEFGDTNHYAKSTPILELKSKDNIDAICRAQIKWQQVRPDVWVAHRGAFTDPFDMLEEKCANMMRDWLLSVPYADALEEKSKGFTKVEHQWSAELNDTGRVYGVKVLGIEITTLRFPSVDKQDEQLALQLAETNLAIETSRQNATKEKEISRLNQATHVRMQEDRDREAEAEERQQEVERRKNKAEAETITKKAEMDTLVVEAEKNLALAQQNQTKEVELAKATAEAESDRVRAQGKRDAARLAAEGEIAETQEKNKAQLEFLTQQAELLRKSPGLVELLKIQNDLLKTQALALAAQTNPNVVLLTGQEGLEARRMNNGHAPLVPGSAIVSQVK